MLEKRSHKLDVVALALLALCVFLTLSLVTYNPADPPSSLVYPEHTKIANACGRSCGMNDLVILRRDSVVDAIFRSPNRHYTGQSSSPQEARPQVSARKATPSPPTRRRPAGPPDLRRGSPGVPSATA